MKTRQGFVSNSSTSSFIIAVSKEQYKEVYDKCDDYQKALLEEMKWEKKAFGLDLVMFTGCTGNYSSFEDMDIPIPGDLDEEEFYDKYGYEPWPEEAWYEIKWPKDCIEVEVDC